MNRTGAAHTRAWTRLITSRSGRHRAAVAALTAGILLTGALDGSGTALASVKPAAKALRVTTTSLPAGTGGKVYSAKLAATGGIKPYTWSVTQGSLPAGLTLVPATGLINGVPTVSGTSDFTVAVTDSENPAATATAAESISVNVPALVITTISLPQATAGVAYSAKLAATGGIKPYTWSVTSGPLPTGLKLAAATGVISGTPTTSGDFTIGVAVTDGESPPASTPGTVSLSIGVAPLVVTTGGTLPTATTGAPYSVHLNAAGGVKPYTWTVASGSLPAGFKLSRTGIISGTPTTGGTATFTVQVADAENPAATATATESLTVAAALTVTTTSLPGGTADQPYTATLNAAGGVTPYTWSVSSGSLPAGLSLDPATGAISGTPTGTGTATFTAAVTDAGNPPVTATASLTIAVTALPLAVTTTTLPDAIQNTFYEATLAASGGVTPYAWSVVSGSLPGGLQLDQNSGDISGAPSGLGLFTFTVQVTDSDDPAVIADETLSITVAAALAVTTTSLPTAVAGQSYMQTLTAVGGIPPYTWSISSGALPTGLALDPGTGTISGTTAELGRFVVTVQVTDSGSPPATATTTLAIAVVAPLAVTTTSLPTATQGASYSAQLAATGGVTPYTWSISGGSLPPGLALDPGSGTISGTATELGTFPVTIEVTDSSSPAATATANLSITVAAPLAVTTTSLPGSEAGEPYSAGLSASGGVPPYTWTAVSGLPPGLSLATGTGVVSGVPASEGPYSITVGVTDSADPAATTQATVHIVVNPPLIFNDSFTPNATVGQPYEGQVMASGGVAPITYSIPQGEILPPGLQLNPGDGAIVGTPETAGDFSFSVQATDSDSPPVTVARPEDIEVAPQLTITSLEPPPATQYVGYTDQLTATGGYPPYTWSAASGELPSGITLTPAGVLTGTPAEGGTFAVSVSVIDSNAPVGVTTMTVTIQVIPQPPPYGPLQQARAARAQAVLARLRG
jgi:Putative Ig domain